jgi:hypothetical protein
LFFKEYVLNLFIFLTNATSAFGAKQTKQTLVAVSQQQQQPKGKFYYKYYITRSIGVLIHPAAFFNKSFRAFFPFCLNFFQGPSRIGDFGMYATDVFILRVKKKRTCSCLMYRPIAELAHLFRFPRTCIMSIYFTDYNN